MPYCSFSSEYSLDCRESEESAAAGRHSSSVKAVLVPLGSPPLQTVHQISPLEHTFFCCLSVAFFLHKLQLVAGLTLLTLLSW